MRHQEVIGFWFSELSPKNWWQKDDALDTRIAERFGELHASAVACELFGWRESAEGRLAEILVLDQFSRNIFRGTPRAFAADPLALALAQEAVALDLGSSLEGDQRAFLYMPYMHSESRRVHEVAEQLFGTCSEQSLAFERKHKAIVDRFGRYPHRNAILGRRSTPEEEEFLRQAGSSF